MKFSHPTVGRLVALLRVQFSDDTGAKALDASLFDSLDDGQWAELFDLAARQGVLAIAYDALRDNGLEQQIPRGVRIKWALSVESIEARFERQQKAAHELVELFAGHGIRMMIFKGLALSRHYPTPHHREFGDLDIWLFGDYDKANKIIESHGIAVDYHDRKNSSFAFNGILIENHHAFTYGRNKSDRLLESCFAGSLQNTMSVVGGYYTPSPEFNAIYLLHHASRHFLQSGFNMRTVVDWGAFLKAEQKALDMGTFAGQLKSVGLVRFSDAMTFAAADILGMDFTPLLLGTVPENDRTMILEQMLAPERSNAGLTHRINALLKSRPRYRMVPYNFLRDGVLRIVR